jgi:oligo-1,6-glucosidase
MADRLDYLADLGVDVLWLSPIYPSPQDDAGYDICEYQDVDPMFGSLEDFDALLAAVHARGAADHGPGRQPHVRRASWFVDARSGPAKPKRDWCWRRPPRRGMTGGRAGAEPSNWISFFSGPAWECVQPRVVSRSGDDGEHRVRAAKMLVTVLHLHRERPTFTRARN